MSSAPEATPTAWPVLSMLERRVLGVLAEKQKTTPDSYPMTLNALVTGCNQKSNRDPVLNLSDDQVEDALRAAQQKGLAIRLTGSGRAEKWRHNLYDTWHVDKTEMAVLIELLLRGPQTEGELRGRASRMEPIDDLEALRRVCKPLAERGLIVYLTPEGRRGTVLTHGFHAPDELERLRAAQPAEPAPSAAPVAAAATARPAVEEALKAYDERLEAARAEIAELRSAVAGLRSAHAGLTDEVRQIKEGLGL
jgi:uncharacterized protein YceH (UPF0502 family)